MSKRQGSESIAALVNHWRWLKDQGPSYKLQASSCKRLTAAVGYDRIDLERINYD